MEKAKNICRTYSQHTIEYIMRSYMQCWALRGTVTIMAGDGDTI